jgi:hypothetical protein
MCCNNNFSWKYWDVVGTKLSGTSRDPNCGDADYRGATLSFLSVRQNNHVTFSYTHIYYRLHRVKNVTPV